MMSRESSRTLGDQPGRIGLLSSPIFTIQGSPDRVCRTGIVSTPVQFEFVVDLISKRVRAVRESCLSRSSAPGSHFTFGKGEKLWLTQMLHLKPAPLT